MSNIKRDIIIIGAGLTGLSMAHFLKKAGKDVLVLEKEKNTGGVINTITENGFIFESGPNTGVLSSFELASLFRDLDQKCSIETANAGAKKRYILKGGKWQALPSGLISGITTPLFTFKDKLRILGEPFRKPGTDENESVAGLVRRRLGKSFLDYAVDPFISGIYAGDPELLVTRFALPKLYALEQNYGSFIRGAIKKARQPKTAEMKMATGEVFSAKNGLSSLVGALAAEAGSDNLLTDVSEVRVLPVENGYSVSFLRDGMRVDSHSSIVITTFGGPGITETLPFIDKNLVEPVSDMKYAGVVQAAVGYLKWRGLPLDAFGGLIPSKEKRNALGILFPSAIFNNRAPRNGALLSIFIGGSRNRGILEKSESEIKQIVMKEIRETMGEYGDPDLFRIFRHPRAIPQYEKSTGARLESIKKIQEIYPGLILAGNIRDGIGMSDRVKQARNISREITGV